MLERIPLMIRNGHRLQSEPHTESLPGIRLHMKDLGDTGPQVLGLCHGVHHCHDDLVHWCHGPALLGTAGPSRGGVVGVTPEGPASSSSCCECCEACEALGGCYEGGWGSAASS